MYAISCALPEAGDVSLNSGLSWLKALEQKQSAVVRQLESDSFRRRRSHSSLAVASKHLADEVIDGGGKDCCSAASKLTRGYTKRLGEPYASIEGVFVSVTLRRWCGKPGGQA